MDEPRLVGWPEPVPYANLGDPQSLNLYAYVDNNPVTVIDGDGHNIVIDGLEQVNVWGGGNGGSMLGLGSNAVAACPGACSGFTENGEFAEYVAGAGGAAGYIRFSDLVQGINEWGGAFYSNTQFQSQIIAPRVVSLFRKK